MKIAILGWYGHNNAGDERIKHALDTFIKKLVSSCELYFYDLHECASQKKESHFNEYDLVIIGGGGLILSPANYHNFLLGLATKVITLGISVEGSLIGNRLKFAKALLKKSIKVCVRDQRSFELLKPLDQRGILIKSADVTFLDPFSIRKPSKTSLIGINLLPKPINYSYSSFLNFYIPRFYKLLTRIGIQKHVKIYDFQGLVDTLSANHQILPIPLYCENTPLGTPLANQSDSEYLQTLLTSVPRKFDHMSINKCRAIISMRLHASIFAIQKGVPFVSLAYLPKNQALMKEAHLDEFVTSDFTTKHLCELFDKLLNSEASVKERLLDYRERACRDIQRTVTHIFDSL